MATIDWGALATAIEAAITTHLTDGKGMAVSVSNGDKLITYNSVKDAMEALEHAQRMDKLTNPATRTQRTMLGRFRRFEA